MESCRIVAKSEHSYRSDDVASCRGMVLFGSWIIMLYEWIGGRSIEGPMILYGLLGSLGSGSVRRGVSCGIDCSWIGVFMMVMVFVDVNHWLFLKQSGWIGCAWVGIGVHQFPSLYSSGFGWLHIECGSSDDHLAA